MKKTVTILLSIAISGIMFASDTLFFKVSLLGVKCAKVALIENYLEDDVVEIIYHAYTVGPFWNLYPTDNWYYYYTDKSYSHLDSLKKIINDKDLKQEYHENYSDGEVLYNKDLSFSYDRPLHHILTSLVFFEHHPEYIKTGIELPFDITDEGDIYQEKIDVVSNYRKAQDEVYFSLNHIAGKEYISKTDVFNWMICAGEGNRMLAFSHDDHKISEGYFSLGWGGLNLRAKRVKK